MQIKVTTNDGGEHVVEYDSQADTIQVLCAGQVSYAWADVKSIEITDEEAAPAPVVDLFEASGADRPVEAQLVVETPAEPKT